MENQSTNNYQEVTISTTPVIDAYRCRECFLSLEGLIQSATEVVFHTKGLQHKNAHPDDSLFGGVRTVLNRVVENENDEVVAAFRVDDERPESLITLYGLPKEHNHLRRPSNWLLASGKIRGSGFQLNIIRSIIYHEKKYAFYRLLQGSCHSVTDKLKVLWSMQSPKKMTKEILWWEALPVFWYRV